MFLLVNFARDLAGRSLDTKTFTFLELKKGCGMADPLGIPVYLEGACHLSIFLLSCPKSEAHQGNAACLGSVGSCSALSRFGLYLRAHQASQTGLASSYVAVVGDNYIQKCLRSLGLGKFHKLVTNNTSSERTSQSDFSPLERLSQSLDSLSPASPWLHKSHDTTGSSIMALQLHSLMDKMPKSRYSIVEVYWLVEAEDLPPPSCFIDLYGALLRLKEWHNAHIEIVTASHTTGRGAAKGVVSLPGLQSWREALDVDVVCSCLEWTPPTGVIWRGDIYFTENKNCKQTVNQTVSFPGLSLSLNPILANDGSCLPEQGGGVADMLRGVGVVSSNYCPTHLQLLQVVDYSTVPLFWVSPLRSKLSVSSDYNVTKALFKSLMGPNNKSVAFIMCLSQLDESLKETHSKKQSEGSSLTTANWLAHVSGLEEEGEVIPSERSVSPLAAYETGPLLLVLPSREGNDVIENENRLSYDAWFLWRPEAIDSNIFVKLKAEGLQVAEDCEEDDVGLSLPLVFTPPGSPFSPTNSPSSPSDIHSRLSSLSHELSVPPSDSIEMKALKTHEWIQRKMIRRLTTPDLMFGQMVAPRPVGVASLSESISITDVLGCFTTEGRPTNADLSPIAMRDPSQVTRVHDPASSDVSYGTIIASTPSSKRQYHGVHYCLTNEDTSKDTKWTKIQQRCLISERAGHCSNVSTPRTVRDQRQSRRLKEVQLQNSKKQQKEKESEEQKRKSMDGGKEGGKALMEDKENGPEGGENLRRKEKENRGKVVGGSDVVLKSRRSLNFPRSDVKLVKSPTVKITRLSSSLSRQKRSGFAKPLPPTGKNKMTNLQTDKTAKMPEEPLVQQTIATNQDRASERGAVNVTSPIKDRTTSEKSENGAQESDSAISQEVGGESSVAMECSSSVLSPVTPPCTGNGSVWTGSSSSPVRRSPRLKSRLLEANKKGTSSRDGSNSAAKKKRKSDTEKKKEKSLKAQLGQSVVSVLKKNGVSREHPLFKQYYTKLFNISKHFLNDLKQLTGRKVVTEEMKRVVQLNVGRVVCPDNT